MSRPPSVAKYIPEWEKRNKLNHCQKYLAELQAGGNPEHPQQKAVDMAQCLTDIQDLLNNMEKEKRIAEGEDPNNIFCYNSCFRNLTEPHVWFKEYPTSAFCTHAPIKINCSRPPGLLRASLTEEEKANKLNHCRHKKLASLIDSQEEYQMAQCLMSIQKALNVKKKAELVAEGKKPYCTVCRSQFLANRHIWEKDPAHVYANCSEQLTQCRGMGLIVPGPPIAKEVKQSKLNECRQYLANLDIPVPDDWDTCIKNTMKEAKREVILSMQQQDPSVIGGIRCTGNYGTTKGWRVSCSAPNGGSTTGYKPYPAECPLPQDRAIATSDPGQR